MGMSSMKAFEDAKEALARLQDQREISAAAAVRKLSSEIDRLAGIGVPVKEIRTILCDAGLDVEEQTIWRRKEKRKGRRAKATATAGAVKSEQKPSQTEPRREAQPESQPVMKPEPQPEVQVKPEAKQSETRGQEDWRKRASAQGFRQRPKDNSFIGE